MKLERIRLSLTDNEVVGLARLTDGGLNEEKGIRDIGNYRLKDFYVLYPDGIERDEKGEISNKNLVDLAIIEMGTGMRDEDYSQENDHKAILTAEDDELLLKGYLQLKNILSEYGN